MLKTISFEDFNKVDIRIGTIVSAANFTKAKKPAYQLIIDFGTLGIKKSSAQITKLYSTDDLLHKQVLAVVNFLPKQIANFMSECLILGVINKSGKVVLLESNKKIKNGSQVN
ncbi:MAG: tRNA-binding protein [Flavobacteriales bacterium]|nr:MAG: tRNA-binding protein [Flavobacteriales bacterium]